MEREQTEGSQSEASRPAEPRGQAAEGLQTALTLLEEERLGHQESGDRASEAEALRKIGDLQRTNGKYDAAREAYTKARYLHQLLGDAPGAATILVIVGKMELGLRRWDAAARAFVQASDLYRRVLDNAAEADALLSLGDAQVNLAQRDAARETYLNAARLYASLDDALGQAHASFRLASLYGDDEKERADEYLEFAEAMYRHVAEQQPPPGRTTAPPQVRDSRLVPAALMAEVCARQRRVLRGEEKVPEEPGEGAEDSGDEVLAAAGEAAAETRPWVLYAGGAAVALAVLLLLLPHLWGGDGPGPFASLTLGSLVYVAVALFGATCAIVVARQQGVTAPAVLLGVGIGFAAIFFEIGRAMYPSLGAAPPAPNAAEFAEEVPESIRRARQEAPVFERRAQALLSRGDIDAARKAFGQALAGFEIAHEIDGQARVLLAQADMEYANGAPREALDLYRRAFLLSRADAAGNTGDLQAVLQKMIELAKSLGDDERLLEAHVNLLSLKEKAGDAAALGQEYMTLADLHRQRGDYERAHEWYGRAHGAFQELRDKRGQVKALLAMAEIEQFLGRRRQAYGSYYHAFVLYREMDDASGQAAMLLYLGAIDELAERWDEASAAFRQAWRIYEALGDHAGVAKAQFRYGAVEAAHGNARQAREAFHASLGFFESIGDTSSQAGVLRGLGRLQERDEDFDGARAQYRHALELYRAGRGEVADLGALAVLLDLALLERKTDHEEAAAAAYADARVKVRELADESQRARLLLGVADMAVKLGHADEATDMYNEAMALFVMLGDTSGEASARDRLAALASGRAHAGI